MATYGGKDRSSGPGGQGSDTAGGKAGAGPADSHDSGGGYSVGKDRNSNAGALAVAAANARAKLNATPTTVMAGASGGFNSLSGLTARDPLTAAAVQARNNYDEANQGLGAGLLDKIAGISPLDPTSRLQNSLKTGIIPDTKVDYGLDVPGTVAGVAGTATGLPLSSTYEALREIAVRTGLIDKDFGKANLGSGGANPRVADGTGNTRSGGDQGGGLLTGGNRNNPLTNNGKTVPTSPPPPPPPPPPPTVAAPTWADEIASLTPKLRADFDWARGQRGLSDKTLDTGGNAINWDDVFNRELQHRLQGMPIGSQGTTQADFDKAANQYLTADFGTGALDDYQTQVRSNLRSNLDSLGLNKEFNTRFGQDDVQGYLNDVYNTQYKQAKTLLDNTNARGEFNQFGYNAALEDLGRQGTAGKATLNDLAGSYLTTDKGSLKDALSAIYDKIGNYTLGGENPITSDVNDLKTKENTLSGNLHGQILGGAPSVFDTSSTFQRASAQQGATSGGTLSDTLAQRNLTNRRSRGLSNTGAF